MNDDVLSRAKKLAEAANIVAAQMSQQANDFLSISNLRQQQIELEDNRLRVECEAKELVTKAPCRADIGQSREFKGAVIQGSSLITTYSDIRACTTRGSKINIDGINCIIATKGEWNGSRIELEKDFSGPTNLDAIIIIEITEEIINKKSSPKKIKMIPISSYEISNAVTDLNDFKDRMASIPMKNLSEEYSRKTKLKKKPSNGLIESSMTSNKSIIK
eukprot:gene13386-28380_t